MNKRIAQKVVNNQYKKGSKIITILAALNELASLRIYKDDYETTKERLEECLKNSRCPECGCGDVIEAESNECGCDAPVCAVECPETLAEAYVRVCNELAALRAENEAFREDHHKHDEWMAWAQSYFNNHTDLCMWGSRLDVGIRETLIARDQELAQLRQERDALVKERDELKNGILRVQVQFFRENVVAVINAEKLPELIKQLIATHSVNITPTKQKTEPLPVKVGKAMRECIRVESPTTKDGDA